MHTLGISADGRSFVDQRGEPVFWMGTTQWELVRRYTVGTTGFTGRSAYSAGAPASFKTPDAWEDALLLLEGTGT